MQSLSTKTNGVSAPKHMKRAWWKESVVYQIYPSSFKDSNNDGLGDIPGITSKLDYIKSLGADIVWSSPILASPQVDMGYDISDYRDVHPPYGTLQDLQDLIDALHSRGMKYVMDLVVNHTSDQHEWFKSSRSSKSSPHRDWYMWKPAKYDENGVRQPPNNWISYFGGSAWTWDEGSQEYYLHLFAIEQPDLNWENDDVRKEIYDMITWWLDRGVDGFRMDVINFISKVPGLPDAPITNPNSEFQSGHDHFACGPRLHEFLHDIGTILKKYDAFSVGEMPAVYDLKEVLKAVGSDRDELNMIFHFEIVDLDGAAHDKFSEYKWTLAQLRNLVVKWQRFMIDNDGWNALYLENHDQGRSVSRFASHAPSLRFASSKMLATFLALQCGTVFVYQGQELAQANVPDDWDVDRFRDIECLNHWAEKQPIIGHDPEAVAAQKTQYKLKSRDNARTPMQWDGSAHAGFTGADATPWMDVHENHAEWNAEKQVADKTSPYWYWADVLALRKEHVDVFVYGDFALVGADDLHVLAYKRVFVPPQAQAQTQGDGEVEVEGDRKMEALIVCNFQDRDIEWNVPPAERKLLASGRTLLASYGGEAPKGESAEGDVVRLRPFEAFVVGSF